MSGAPVRVALAGCGAWGRTVFASLRAGSDRASVPADQLDRSAPHV